MANYEQSGNRYTLILLREYQKGQSEPFYKILPYEYVRFNVDQNPSAEAVIVPIPLPDGATEMKIYEKIEFVDSEPNRPSVGGAFSATDNFKG